jgi:hypothetical protein
MERDIMWTPWSDPGLEHLHIVEHAGEILADGLIIGVRDGAPFRARYVIRCDGGWTVRAAHVELLGDDGQEIALVADGAGRWTAATGAPIPSLDGCPDVDISATPFTNTLAIRRLGLRPGESVDISVAYIAAPKLRLWPVRQRYTCLSMAPDGGR